MKVRFFSVAWVFFLVVPLLRQGNQINAGITNTEKRPEDLSNSQWKSQPCDSEADEPCTYKNDDEITRTRTERDSPGYCPSDWYTFGAKCYRTFGTLSYSQKSWNDAVASCRSENAKLVSIHNAYEQDFLIMLLMEIRSATWIGLSRSSGNPSVFDWADSSSLSFTNWAEGEPNNHLSQENCVHMNYDSYNSGEWNDATCSYRWSYICEKPKDTSLTNPGRDPGSCIDPKGWLKMRTSCYKVFDKTASYLSWSQAQSLCKSYEGNLAYVKNDAVAMLLRLNLRKLQGPFWIGIKSTREHRYTWLGENEPLVFSNWKSGQPVELEDEQNCVAIDTQGEWMVRDCDENHPFICEVSEEGPIAPTMEPYHPNMTCPYSSPKWHDFGGKYCYIINMNSKTNWHEASCACSEEGGFLSSFHSRKEIDVIMHHVKHHDIPLHIGFERDAQGSFVWSDESPTDYTNWNRGEPNDLGEQCAEMKIPTGKWNDIPCSSIHGYICSAHKVPERNETVTASKRKKGRGVATIKSQDIPGSTETHLTAAGISLMVVAFVAAIAAFALYRFRYARTDKSTYSSIK